jgi:hypothetical protein
MLIGGAGRDAKRIAAHIAARTRRAAGSATNALLAHQ